jgi:hypothetical protein
MNKREENALRNILKDLSIYAVGKDREGTMYGEKEFGGNNYSDKDFLECVQRLNDCLEEIISGV